MESEYILPLKRTQETDDELDYTFVLNAMKEVIWVNEKAARYFQFHLSLEDHLDPLSMGKLYGYLSKLEKSTIKNSHISLLDKKKKLMHFKVNGMYDHCNETYVINFRPVTDELSLLEVYNKTFKMLDEIHIGAFVSRSDGFIFSTNETAKYIVPNACQMTIITLLRRFFCDEQFDYYVKLLNRKESFSVNVTCQITNNTYHLTYKYDHELHMIMIHPFLSTDNMKQRTKQNEFLDKQTVASIVHEIRNPLTALQGFVDLMKAGGDLNTEYLKLLDYELRRMDHLLSGMLQVLTPKKDIMPIECNSLFKKILLLLEMEMKNKDICLVYSQPSEPCYILGNEYSLTQILLNIIKNSIQAVGVNGSISITSNKSQNDELEVCIKDSGSGMSEEQLSYLFTPYYTTKEYGTGLGLPIVKKLLEEIGGRIEVRSTLGHGTEVYVYLKLVNECDYKFENCGE